MAGIKGLDQDASLRNGKDVISPWRQNQGNLISQSSVEWAWQSMEKPGRTDGQVEKQASLILAAGKMQMETSGQEYQRTESCVVRKGKL